MVQGNEPGMVGQEKSPEVEQLKRHLEMLDERLDNIDSMVSAVVERVMNQPLILSVTCPHCGKNVDIAIMGSMKLTK